jgi:hypothetical protein
MHEEFTAIAMSREDAHEAITRGYAHAKALLASGENVLVTVKPALEPISVQQRRFFHGPVLNQISEQVRVNGERFTTDIWKRHLKNVILEREPKYEMVKLPGAKRATPRRVYRSTETLGVRAYSKFIDDCIDFATLEWGVQFVFEPSEREQVRYVRPTRSTKEAEHEQPADA